MGGVRKSENELTTAQKLEQSRRMMRYHAEHRDRHQAWFDLTAQEIAELERELEQQNATVEAQPLRLVSETNG